MSRPSMTARGAGFHDSVAERTSNGISNGTLNRRNGILYTNDHCTLITDQYYKRSHGFREEFQMFHDDRQHNIHAETCRSIPRERTYTIQLHRRGTQDKCFNNFSISLDGNWGCANRDDRSASLKRKAPDGDIDLNLSLNTRSRREEDIKVALDEEEVLDKNLCLSLSSPLKKVNYSIDLNMPSKLAD